MARQVLSSLHSVRIAAAGPHWRSGHIPPRGAQVPQLSLQQNWPTLHRLGPQGLPAGSAFGVRTSRSIDDGTSAPEPPFDALPVTAWALTCALSRVESVES